METEIVLEKRIESAATEKPPLFSRIRDYLAYSHQSFYETYGCIDTSAENGWQNRMEILRSLRNGGLK